MNGEKRTTEAAEMERGKEEAPARVEPGQGQGTTRHPHITTKRPHVQELAAQRAKLLAMLRRGPVSTLEARAAAIMHPAGRVHELREAGFEIHTGTSENRVGVYYLIDPPRRPQNDE